MSDDVQVESSGSLPAPRTTERDRSGADRNPARGPSGSPSSPLPPPDPDARPATASAAAPHRDLDEMLAGWMERLPFDTVGEGLEWWFRPVVELRTWVALGSLLVGAVWGPLMFVAVAAVASATFALSIVGIGLLLVVPSFALVNAMTTIERRRAGWTGEVIAPAQLATTSGGWWSSILTRLGDPARWRQVLYIALFLLGGPVLFAAGSAPWWFVLSRIFGLGPGSPGIGFFSFELLGLVAAAVVAGLAPRVTVGAAAVGRSFTAALLGPTEAAELQERVSELSGQRQQILDAVAEERRRIERNLHDGVQQQLVALGIDIGLARTKLDSDPVVAAELLDAARDKIRGSIGELRMIGRGLNPAVLDDRGLDAALSAVVAESPIPISVDITTDASLDDDIAATAYYVANEAVANVLKHAHARVASIRLEDDLSGGVRLTVHDDGRGGADPGAGTGLAGMRARVEGVDGTFTVDSPPGGPTRLIAVLPTSPPQRS